MAIIYSAAPGSASNSLKKRLEILLNCNSTEVKNGNGIGHLSISIPIRDRITNKLNLHFLNKTKLIYGHIFPTNYNLNLFNKYYNIKHFIISYRNIYEQLNYLYKWVKKRNRGPISFPENRYFSIENNLINKSFVVDLDLLLILEFYKHWFYLIQNNKLKNFTLFSFEEITTSNKNYENKMKNIFENFEDRNRVQNLNNIKENVFEKEKFEINPRHKNIIEEFISYYKNVDFSLIV